MDSAESVSLWEGSDDENSSRRVLVLPGARYSADRPGLAWPCRALATSGWQVWIATWNMPMDQPARERQALVDAAVDGFVSQTGGLPQLVLAKSVGTLAAGWVADHGIPAIWTTPLLDDGSCVSHIARATSPAVLVAGSRDHTWDDAGAVRSGKSVHMIEGADHGWQTGDWRTELAVIRELTDVVEAFATAVPGPQVHRS